jgi:hypothetical protein
MSFLCLSVCRCLTGFCGKSDRCENISFFNGRGRRKTKCFFLIRQQALGNYLHVGDARFASMLIINS